MSFPEVHLIGGTRTEAGRLAPVAVALRTAGLLDPVLIATGPGTAAVARALAASDLRPDVTLPAETGLLETMIRRLDTLWATRPPAAVLVQGDGAAGLAGALAAAWRRIPIVHLSAGQRGDEFAAPSAGEATGRLIAQLAALHLVPAPIAAMNLLDEGVAAGAILLTGDTAADAPRTTAGRRLPRPAGPHPYGDGRAAQRAAQATAALLGLAGRPAPMPIPLFPAAPAGVTFGA